MQLCQKLQTASARECDGASAYAIYHHTCVYTYTLSNNNYYTQLLCTA